MMPDSWSQGRADLGAELSSQSRRLLFDDFELEPDERILRRGGEILPLQPQPLRLLALLAERSGRVVSREAIRRHLWGDETHVDAEQGINFAIRKLRRTLADEAKSPRFIETVRGVGYRFLIPVEVRKAKAAEGSAEGRQESVLLADPGSSGREGGGRWFSRVPLPEDLRPRIAASLVFLLTLLLVTSAVTTTAWIASPPESEPAPAGGLELQLETAVPELPVELPRLAIAPLLETGIASSHQGLGEVLSEELTGVLAQRLRSRVGVLTPASARALAAEVGNGAADYQLRGSLRAEGDEWRIALRLSRQLDQLVLWGEQRRLSLDQLPAYFHQVAREVDGVMEEQPSRLSHGLLPQAPESLATAANPLPAGAMEDYLHALYLVRQGSASQQTAGLAQLRTIAGGHPENAAAQEAVADALLRTYAHRPVVETLREVEVLALRALALDSERIPARLQRATVELHLHLDLQAAGALVEDVLAERPNHQGALHLHGLILSASGRHDAAVAAIQRAAALDPATVYTTSDLGVVLFRARRYQEAEAVVRRNLELSPGDPTALGQLAAILFKTGRRQEAEGPLNRLLEVYGGEGRGGWEPWSWQDAFPALDAQLAGELLSGATQRGSAVDRASLRAAVKDHRGSLELLAEACEGRDDWALPYVATDPRFDTLWSAQEGARSKGCWPVPA